ncbi:MAG: IS1380 family transposase, partial [Prevotella sp.]|nr:IS1380 family transposase [Prevotella sp.]
MSDFSLILVLQIKTSVNRNKTWQSVQIKSEKLTPFGGIFSIMEQFDSMLSPIIDQTLGQRCSSIIGYQYS